MRKRPRQLTTCIIALVVALPARSANIQLLSVSIRARLGERSIIGAQQSAQFKEYDAMATMGLPWQWNSSAQWSVGSRLLTSAGIIEGARNAALITSVIPALSFGRRDGFFTVDGGAGMAVLSSHRFGVQNFGGALQFALTLGLGTRFTRHFGLGYRYLHYSDAGLHGRRTTGADFHMAEIAYWF